MGWQLAAAVLCLNVCRPLGKMSQPTFKRMAASLPSPAPYATTVHEAPPAGDTGGDRAALLMRAVPAVLPGSSPGKVSSPTLKHCYEHQHSAGSRIIPKPRSFMRIICLPLCGSLKTFVLTMKAIINSTH